MTSTPVQSRKRYFTVEDANRTLPLVRRIVSDVVRQWEIVNELEQRLAVVGPNRGSRRPRPDDLYDEEVRRSQETLEAERARLAEYIEELQALGVELKGMDGLCDFPSLLDGREVYLCWRLGEPEVAYWHELHSGYAGRKPIPGRTAAPQPT
ncbi:MAG: hypothetical protein KatS3mg108_3463 [Isosphaeraceae bacterium]|jgi:hypothetical protein|nr:MAG: hypothetical protein KatS3mg108_3463 [Isosphaeraceae bacterium]